MAALLLLWIAATITNAEVGQSDRNTEGLPNAGTLLAAQIVHRHGDRSPVTPMPAYAPHWSLAAGALSSIGVAQHMQFGHTIRQRFGGSFLPDCWKPEFMYVRSTEVER